MKKKILFALNYLLLLNLTIHALIPSSSSSTEKWTSKRRCVSTKWFDIIYPIESEQTAAILAENADQIYNEIGDFFGREPQVRMPVLIEPKTEQFNANFSDAPYNRIVLFDTAVMDDLEVFSNTILSTFRHELTHAFTFNIKNGFWSAIGNIFGDCINPAHLFISYGWGESATMTSESSGGEGRLNDEYSKQMVRQAKIEHCFPDYKDVKGSRDIFPQNSSYYFYGAFAEWLQKEYGMDKYLSFWYKCVNFQTISEEVAFHSVYEIKLKDAWKLFEASVNIPENLINPLENSHFFDFFSKNPDKFSKGNSNFARYNNLIASDDNIYFQLSNTGKFFSVSKKNLSKPKMIFSFYGADELSASKDSRFLVLGYWDQNGKYPLHRLKIYDCKRKSFKTISGHGIKNAQIIATEGHYYLVAEKFQSQRKYLSIQRVILKNDRIKSIEHLFEEELPENTSHSSYTQISDDKFSYIKRSGLNYSIETRNLAGEILSTYNFPADRMVLRSLSFSQEDNALFFSFTRPGQMPSWGNINLSDSTIYLSENNISGGVYSPVKAEGKLIYIGQFFSTHKLIYIEDNESFYTYSEVISEKNKENEDYKGITLKNSTEDLLKNAKNFHTIQFFKNGLFLPASLVTSLDMNLENAFNSASAIQTGVTYITTDPMATNILIASGGYGYATNSGAAQLAYNFTYGDLLKLSTSFYGEIDGKGFKQTAVSGNASSSVYLFNNSTIANLTLGGTYAYGRDNLSLMEISNPLLLLRPGCLQLEDNKDYILAQGTSSFIISRITKGGRSSYEKGGFAIGANLNYIFNEPETKEWQINNLIISPTIGIYIPKLLPITCKEGLTYSLPSMLSVTAYNSLSSFLTVKAETLLFNVEIQKGLPPLTGLYANSLAFSGGYNAEFGGVSSENHWLLLMNTPENIKNLKSGASPLTDYAYIAANIQLSPNFGLLTGAVSFYLILDGKLYFHMNGNDCTKFVPGFNFRLNM